MRLCDFCKRYIVPKIEGFKKNKAHLLEVLQKLTTSDPLVTVTRPKSTTNAARISKDTVFPQLLEIESQRLFNNCLEAMPRNELINPRSNDPLSTLRGSMADWIDRLEKLVLERKAEPHAERTVMDNIRRDMH